MTKERYEILMTNLSKYMNELAIESKGLTKKLMAAVFTGNSMEIKRIQDRSKEIQHIVEVSEAINNALNVAFLGESLGEIDWDSFKS